MPQLDLVAASLYLHNGKFDKVVPLLDGVKGDTEITAENYFIKALLLISQWRGGPKLRQS